MSPQGVDELGRGGIEKPYKTISYALSKINPCDTVICRDGIYEEQIEINKSGTNESYTTIMCYPNEKAIIKPKSVANYEFIVKINGSFIKLKNMIITTDNMQGSGGGIIMRKGVENIEIIGNEMYGINTHASPSGNINGILCYGNGDSESNTIRNILIKDNYIHDMVLGWSEAITVNGNTDGVDIINNKVIDVTNIGVDIAGNWKVSSNPSLDQARNVRVVGNTFGNCRSLIATSYGIYVDGGRDTLIDRNIVYGCQGGISISAENDNPPHLTRNVKVTNNLVYDCGTPETILGGVAGVGSALKIGSGSSGSSKNIEVYNNTLVHTKASYPVLHIGRVDGAIIKNNILYSNNYNELVYNSKDVSLTSNLVFSNNLYYTDIGSVKAKFKLNNTTIKSFDSWKNVSNDVASVFNYPNFKNKDINNYELRNDSIAIDSGCNQVDSGLLDLLGNKRINNKIDIGAYEN